MCFLTEHHPITLAKTIATLDRASAGCFLFGIGAGWNAEEMANHGVEFKDRWKVTREFVLALRAIWGSAEAEFHGQFRRLRPHLVLAQTHPGGRPSRVPGGRRDQTSQSASIELTEGGLKPTPHRLHRAKCDGYYQALKRQDVDVECAVREISRRRGARPPRRPAAA